MSRLPSLGPRGEGWVVIQFILFAAIFAVGLQAGPPPPGLEGSVAEIVGVGLVAAGGLLAAAGLLGLQSGDALTALPHPRSEAELVESGAYSLVRHPIYGGLVIGAIGWGIVRASLPTVILAAVLLAFFSLKASREEAWLADRYPGYEAYRRRTRRILPWIF
jgi:protein-S-isoprenylcysteine O-methyltransferase Ste14